MAKKKPARGGISKSDAIREVLAAKPDANVKEIREKLAAKGVKASDALINKIKYARTPGRAEKSRSNGGVSKADAIRGMFDQLGHDARPRDIIAELKAQGVIVTSAQVSMLRSKLGKNGSVRKAAVHGHSVPFEHLIAAKQLADRLGGIDKARNALESFARLV